MKIKLLSLFVVGLFVSSAIGQEGANPTAARTWTDASGHYQIQADMIARDEEHVVLQREDKSLVSVEISQLSKEDQEFLGTDNANSVEASEWTLVNGLQIKANVVEYGRREVTIKRYRSRIYVNDRTFDNLPEVYQRMVPKIVSFFENEELEDKSDLTRWVKKQKGVPRTFTCDGVLMELPNGDLYGVPIFFFAENDRKLLEPGLQKYIASLEATELEEESRQREMTSYRLQLQAQAAQAQREKAELQQFARLQLQLQGYSGGLFDLWEVQLVPPNNYGYPVHVVVPGRDSRQAAQAANAKYPNYRVQSIAKVRRRY